MICLAPLLHMNTMPTEWPGCSLGELEQPTSAFTVTSRTRWTWSQKDCGNSFLLTSHDTKWEEESSCKHRADVPSVHYWRRYWYFGQIFILKVYSLAPGEMLFLRKSTFSPILVQHQLLLKPNFRWCQDGKSRAKLFSAIPYFQPH